MLLTSLDLGEEVNNLDLGGKVVEGDRPVTNITPGEMSIHTNMLRQLMLSGIGSNLKSPSAITVERSGGGSWHAKIL